MEELHQRPNLPLATQAAIERAREQVVSRRLLNYLILFTPELGTFIRIVQGLPAQRKAASLKLALQGYSSELFASEAGYYLQHARDKSELRSWLISLAARVKDEIIHARMKISGYEVHCTASEQEHAVNEELKQRIENWIERFRHGTSRKPTASQNREQAVAAGSRRGPKPDLINLRKVVTTTTHIGKDWQNRVDSFCTELDRLKVPVPKTWPQKRPPARSWRRALENYPTLVIRAIKDRLIMAKRHAIY